jgi:hypothetical protein
MRDTKDEALNIAGQCRATASSPLAKMIAVDGGSGLLCELLLDAAKALEALEALAAPVQEPTCSQAIIHAITEYGDARADQDANNAPTTSHERLADCIRLIRDALPPPAAQPAPVPLTDEQINEMANDFEEGYVFLYRSFARAIEAAHGIKENT